MNKLQKSPGPHETSWAVQASVEGIHPQQVFARDLLMEKVGLSMEESTTYVILIGVDASSALKILLQKASDPRNQFECFKTSRERALH